MGMNVIYLISNYSRACLNKSWPITLEIIMFDLDSEFRLIWPILPGYIISCRFPQVLLYILACVRMKAKSAVLLSVAYMCRCVRSSYTIRFINCYGGRTICLFSSISEILSQKWYHCIQYTMHYRMSLESYCLIDQIIYFLTCLLCLQNEQHTAQLVCGYLRYYSFNSWLSYILVIYYQNKQLAYYEFTMSGYTISTDIVATKMRRASQMFKILPRNQHHSFTITSSIMWASYTSVKCYHGGRKIDFIP